MIEYGFITRNTIRTPVIAREDANQRSSHVTSIEKDNRKEENQRSSRDHSRCCPTAHRMERKRSKRDLLSMNRSIV